MPAFVFLAAVAAAAQVPGPRTLRLDYVHTGTATEEHFALDGVVLEGAWPGPLDRWIDETNLGKYYFQVLDRATNRVIYSRGFASIYGEWETTDEAKQQRRAFSRKRALSRARRPGAGGDQEARRHATSSAKSGRWWWIRPTAPSTAARRPN